MEPGRRCFVLPCVFGPHVWNFKDPAKRLVEVGGAVMVKDASQLECELARLIADADSRARTGTAARELVRRQQGATLRTLDGGRYVIYLGTFSKILAAGLRVGWLIAPGPLMQKLTIGKAGSTGSSGRSKPMSASRWRMRVP